MMARTIEAKLVISGEDRTRAAFEGIDKKIKDIASAAKAFNGIKQPRFLSAPPVTRMGWGVAFDKEVQQLKVSARELATIQRSWENFNRALASNGPMKAARHFDALRAWKDTTLSNLRQVRLGLDETERARKRFLHTGARFAAGAAGIGGGAYVANRAVRSTVKAGAVDARETSRDYLAGLTDAESERIKRRSLEVSGRFPSVDASTLHERLRDAAMSVRSVDKASELANTIAEATLVLQSLKGKEAAIEEGRKFFRALDVLGKNIDPKEIRELFDGYVKALGVEGADLNLGGVLQMAKQSRSAGGSLSNRFMMTTGVGLQGDMGDHQVGTALASMLSQVIGGRATEKSKEEQQRFGLRDKKGRFLDGKLAQENPDIYAWEKVIPALRKQKVNVDDPAEVAAATSKLFSNRTVADIFAKMISQREQYQGKAKQYEKAPGLGAAEKLVTKDPFVASEALLAQLRNAASTLSSPLMDRASQGLHSLATSIGNFTRQFSEDDTAGKIGKGAVVGIGAAAAATGGVLAAKKAYNWFTGSDAALRGSALALDGSAAALTRAAAALSAKGVAPDVPAGGKPSPDAPAGKPGPAPAGPKPTIWSRIGTGIERAAPVAMAAGAALAPVAILGAGIYGAPMLFPDDEESAKKRRAHGKTVRDAYRQRIAEDRAREDARTADRDTTKAAADRPMLKRSDDARPDGRTGDLARQAPRPDVFANAQKRFSDAAIAAHERMAGDVQPAGDRAREDARTADRDTAAADRTVRRANPDLTQRRDPKAHPRRDRAREDARRLPPQAPSVEGRRADEEAHSRPPARAGDPPASRPNVVVDVRRRFDEDLVRRLQEIVQSARQDRDGKSVSAPQITETMLHGLQAAIRGADVTAQLTGSAEVKGETTITVKFEAGDGLLKIVEGQREATAQISGRLNPNGPGSAGKASHDALPGWRSTLYGFDK